MATPEVCEFAHKIISSLDKRSREVRKGKSKYVTAEALVLNRIADEKIKLLREIKREVNRL